MTDVRTPGAVFHALADGVPRLILGDSAQLDVLTGLYADVTHVSHPLAPVGTETLRSRSQLRAHFESGPGRMHGVTEFAAVDRVVHVTEDPEVVIGEFRYVGRCGDQRFALPCIFVLRVRDGYIIESRDYVDHIGFARVAGRLPEFAARLVAQQAGEAAG